MALLFDNHRRPGRGSATSQIIKLPCPQWGAAVVPWHCITLIEEGEDREARNIVPIHDYD